MVDITSLSFYDATLSPEELYKAAEEYYAAKIDPLNSTVEENNEMLEVYAKIKIMIAQKQAKIKAFEEAWSAKEQEIRAAHDAELQAFYKEKQAAQDNDYALPQ